MSGGVIRDIVIPVVERIMREQRYFGQYPPYGNPRILDQKLEEYLEEEMRKHFGVIGANGCQHLKEQLEEARRNDPDAFEFLIRMLLERYIRLALKLRSVNIVV